MNIRLSAIALLLAGCLPTSGPSSGSCDECDPGQTEPLPDQDDSCLDDAPASAVQTDLQTIDETGQSYHEMVACGGLSFQINRNLTEVLVSSLLESQGIEVPGGFEWDGEGRYVSSSGGTDMSVSYFYGDDFEVGLEDELVVHDLFDFGNYLRGVTVEADLDGGLDGAIDVHWASTGPLVELLGRGPTPPNPIHFELDALELPYRIGRLKTRTEIAVQTSSGTSTVVYTLASETRRIRPLLDDSELEFETLSSQTINAHGGVLSSTTWGVGYNDVAGALDGAIDFELDGAVALAGRYSFAQSTTPEVSWTCR